MKKIIGVIKPFEYNQTLIVYEDGNKIDICETTMNNLHDNVFTLIDKYNVDKLDFIGPKKYLMGFTEQLKEKVVAKYSKNIEISII